MSLTAGTNLGPYEILAPLGAGGMGEVYRAKDIRLGREVAIKVLPDEVATDPRALARFEHEARAVAALSHPNILSLFDVGESGGIYYAVTELLQGHTLRLALADGPLPVRRTLDIAVQIAEALAAAHENGIVHRDLKPENVFLGPDGRVKLLDFGLARRDVSRLDPSDTVSPTITALSQPGAVVGTVAYMSPEQAKGQQVDFRSDQFSLGIVLYEMLAGARPFKGDSAAEILAGIIRDEPEPLERVAPSTPSPVRLLVERLLTKEPEGRYDSTRDLAREMSTWRLHAPESGPSTAQAKGLPGHRTVVMRALVAVSVVAVAVLVALVFRFQQRPPAAPGPPSVLALPCKVYGAPDFAFLTDAVPGTISTLLAQVEGLDTKVPPTSLEAEKVKGDLSRLAELYQVSSFIVTSLTASPGRFTLNVQLVDAATRKVKWGKQFEGPREAYNELARQAAEGIRLAVRPAASPVPTSGMSSEAELAFREGTYYFNRYDGISLNRPADFDGAVAAFTRALAVDPSFAAAAGKVAELFAVRFEHEGDVQDSLRQAESWARRALGIDPRCGEAWAALSAVEQLKTHADPERGVDCAVRAVAFAPRDAWAHVNLGLWVGGPGSVSLEVAASLRAFELDPFLRPGAANAAAGLCLLGRPGEALAVIDRAIRVEPDWKKGCTFRSLALLRLGRLEEAEKTLEGCQAALTPMRTPGETWKWIRFALAVAQRDNAMSQELARQILASVFDSRADVELVGNTMCFAAPALAHIGRTDDAIRIFEKSVEVGAPPPYDWLLVEPEIQLLRGDPRFAKVLAASRNGAAMVARILGQARARGELPKYLEEPLDDLLRLLAASAGA